MRLALKEKNNATALLHVLAVFQKHFSVFYPKSLMRINEAMVNNRRSNPLKTALYERELLLAANEEKERSLFERWESSVAR